MIVLVVTVVLFCIYAIWVCRMAEKHIEKQYQVWTDWLERDR